MNDKTNRDKIAYYVYHGYVYKKDSGGPYNTITWYSPSRGKWLESIAKLTDLTEMMPINETTALGMVLEQEGTGINGPTIGVCQV